MKKIIPDSPRKRPIRAKYIKAFRSKTTPPTISPYLIGCFKGFIFNLPMIGLTGTALSYGCPKQPKSAHCTKEISTVVFGAREPRYA